MPTPLHILRKDAYLEPKEIAKALNKSVKSYYAWELGYRQPRLSTQKDLARLLNVRPQEILYGKEQ